MAEYIGKSSVKVAGEIDSRENSRGAICGFREGCYFMTAAGDDFFGVAFEKYFTNKFGLEGFGVGKMPGRVECFC